MFKRLMSNKEIFFHNNVKRFNLIYIKRGKVTRKHAERKTEKKPNCGVKYTTNRRNIQTLFSFNM